MTQHVRIVRHCVRGDTARRLERPGAVGPAVPSVPGRVLLRERELRRAVLLCVGGPGCRGHSHRRQRQDQLDPHLRLGRGDRVQGRELPRAIPPVHVERQQPRVGRLGRSHLLLPDRGTLLRHTSSGWGGAYGGGGWGGSGSGHSDGWAARTGADRAATGTTTMGAVGRTPEAENIVRRAYRSVLGREPDPGARSWVNAVMKNNWTQRQLESELMKSAEYRNKR